MVEQEPLSQENTMTNTTTPPCNQSGNFSIKQPEISGYGRIHNFFTTGLISTPKGKSMIQRVEVDERSPVSLLPLSLAADLELALCSGKMSAFIVDNRLVQSSQYSQFSFQVAGHKTWIIAIVVTGLETIVLGRDWMYDVNLIFGIGNQGYYISTSLVVEEARNTMHDADDKKIAKTATFNETVDCISYISSDGELSLDELSFSDAECSYEDDEDDEDDEEDEDDVYSGEDSDGDEAYNNE
ncbi:hypothetical protein V490_00440 [Pseudogymnoascus sp. VKM F-3557]|jgi:hypothetical protein|nr:hypothetical protein V490_00440 [Pseudogymnoascus sp. VKM F-3557]